MNEIYLTSPGGVELFCRIWEPKEDPKAIVQILHGVAEHSARYDHFARWMNEQGYLVVAHDHMGHGMSMMQGLPQGYFKGGWMAAVDDVHCVYEHFAAQYPQIPYYMLGHSMGSFLLRTYLYTYPGSINGAIISGTGWEEPMLTRAGLLVCSVEERRIGELSVSKAMNALMFGPYSKAFKNGRTAFDWLCTVDEVVDAYIEDPLCGFPITVALSREMLCGIEKNEQQENLAKMDRNLPVYFISGAHDPVGHMAKGVLRCVDAFKRAGMREVDVKIYPDGRHEMLNETNREEVYGDVLAWLENI